MDGWTSGRAFEGEMTFLNFIHNKYKKLEENIGKSKNLKIYESWKIHPPKSRKTFRKISDHLPRKTL